MASIVAGGETLVLLPEKAALLPAYRTLLVADAHVGKAQSFRALGVPVPEGATADTLQRLSRLVDAHAVERVVFLGDFLHSAHAHRRTTQQALAQWRECHPTLHCVLVRGNHDDHAGDPPAALRFEVVDEPRRLGGLALVHEPQAVEGAYALGGHLHPCVMLGGRARDSLRLPCFHFGERVGVLPAFGDFTGMHRIRPAAGDRVFVVADGDVREAKLPAA